MRLTARADANRHHKSLYRHAQSSEFLVTIKRRFTLHKQIAPPRRRAWHCVDYCSVVPRNSILPPDYTGEIPPGYLTFRSGTYGVFVFWRGFFKDPKQLAEPVRVMEQTRIYPLGK